MLLKQMLLIFHKPCIECLYGVFVFDIKLFLLDVVSSLLGFYLFLNDGDDSISKGFACEHCYFASLASSSARIASTTSVLNAAPFFSRR